MLKNQNVRCKSEEDERRAKLSDDLWRDFGP
jgi:hypothetical protein